MIHDPAGGGATGRGAEAGSDDAGALDRNHKLAGTAWTSVSRERAVEKVMHRLREKAKEKKTKTKKGEEHQSSPNDMNIAILAGHRNIASPTMSFVPNDNVSGIFLCTSK